MRAVTFLHVSCALVWLAGMLADRIWPRCGEHVLLGRVGLSLGILGFLAVLLTGGRLAGLALVAPLKVAAGLMAQGIAVYGLTVARETSAGSWRVGKVQVFAMALAASVGVHIWLEA